MLNKISESESESESVTEELYCYVCVTTIIFYKCNPGMKEYT